ncbi:MAG: FUN14 domain-containing protein [Candidatus Bathyarchaeia archaeon]
MSEVLPPILPLILPLSIGGIGGFFVGYAVKKVYRLAVIIGAFVFSVAYMAYANVIDLDVGELAETASTFVATFGPFIVPLASSLLFMGSFIVGLIFGLTKG